MDMQPAARQARPEITLAVCRGACRLMRQAGYSVLLETAAARRTARRHLRRRTRRRDHHRRGEVVDRGLAVDDKWPDYLDWCDQLYFAVPVDFPQALIADEIGLIVADAYGGELLRHPPRRPVAAARRKALLIDCARLASERLARLEDPDFVDFVLAASSKPAWRRCAPRCPRWSRPRLASAMRIAGVGHDLGRRADALDAAVHQQRHPVGDGQRRQAMGDHDDGAAARVGLELPQELLLGGRIERAGRLVEDEDARIADQGAGDAEELALAHSTGPGRARPARCCSPAAGAG